MFTFFKPSPKKVRHDLLLDAELSLLSHRQAAEYHEAMFTMLSGRVSSLRAEIAAQQEVDRQEVRVAKDVDNTRRGLLSPGMV